MDRYSVLYLLKKQYHSIYCATLAEAESVLQHIVTQTGGKPIGIYDAKTELFYWEPKQQNKYDLAQIEEQGQLGEQIIQIAQNLRHRNESGHEQANSISQLLQMNL